MLSKTVSRRHVLQGFLALPLVISQPPLAQPIAEALVLSCIDFRFIQREHDFLAQLNLDGHYDWTALAGASLAIAGFPHNEDATAFWDQLDLAYRLHHVRRVIILDHQDCGAFALKFQRSLLNDPEFERQVHQHYLQQALTAIQGRYPDLRVETYLARLDGDIEPMTAAELTT